MMSAFRVILFSLAFSFVTGCGSEPPTVEENAFESLLSAQELIEQGQLDEAMQKLDESITIQPDAWAYFERAQLHAKQGNDKAAKADIDAGIALDSNNHKLLWLKKELKKSESQRFKTPIPER